LGGPPSEIRVWDICVPNFRPIRYVSGTAIRFRSSGCIRAALPLGDSEMTAGAFWLVSALRPRGAENESTTLKWRPAQWRGCPAGIQRGIKGARRTVRRASGSPPTTPPARTFSAADFGRREDSWRKPACAYLRRGGRGRGRFSCRSFGAGRWLGPSIRIRASSQATRRVSRRRSAAVFSAWSRRILMHARIAHQG
jgi:hypothetical protein